MCVLSIKVPIRKKSGNLFNEPRTYNFPDIFMKCPRGVVVKAES